MNVQTSRRAGWAGRSSKAMAYALVAACLLPPAAQARAEPSLSSGTVMAAVERLRAGEYLWAPDVAPQGPMLLVVNLTTQRLVLYRNGLPIAISTISSGQPGHVTPTGVFTILQRQVDHHSNIYNNAPMPYMQRLTWQGVALHGGNLPGYPASHGCIRLPQAFARLLYGETRLGMTVVITEGVTTPRIAPPPAMLRAASPPAPGASADPSAQMSWHPERSPTGPVSIIVSGADQRVLVLRNGRIIGSAPVAIDGQIDGVSAYVLRSIGPAGPVWLRIPLPGQSPQTEIAAQDRGRLHVADAFRGQVLSVLQPGTTVLVTGDSLRSGGTGQELTVITDDRAR